ncbi:uncharacterized protein I303_107014 [Kwoniella dejecticola CBS 10117]|uniref:PARP-type domain-containing protein n=1 Tax=Kwoniella dejecticola CBS 10117 TaxID=1296121 RepID=A0A1A5ZYI5_9TREE|nr:uncharacterized protein I303_06415 [Kwoniella dejecticola CBS 10117]OBR82858.1 hypothetical protein I303_06415 [Kwoniella dejecticola CBS 10117]
MSSQSNDNATADDALKARIMIAAIATGIVALLAFIVLYTFHLVDKRNLRKGLGLFNPKCKYCKTPFRPGVKVDELEEQVYKSWWFRMRSSDWYHPKCYDEKFKHGQV